jgi:PAS domain S-box-containing protein
MHSVTSPSTPEFRRNLFQAILLPLGLTFLAIAALTGLLLRELRLGDAVEHSGQVLMRLNTLQDHLNDRARALRDYSNTSHTNDLDAYDRANSLIPNEMNELNAFVSDNRSQLQQLERIQRAADEWAAFASEVKANVSQGGDGKGLMASERARNLRDGIQKELGSFYDAESTLRQQRSDQARAGTRWLFAWTVVLTGLLGIVISILSRRQAMKLTQMYFEMTGQAQGTAESQARLAAIVDSSDDAIIGKTLDGIVTSWNFGAERIFGYGADEVIGKSILFLLPLDHQDEEKEILAKLRRGERVDHFETVRVKKDGQQIEVSLTISPIKDASGRIVGASKIARDISSKKRIEEDRARLLESERAARSKAEHASQTKDEFLATLSHELRTPLNAILGWSQLLKVGPLEAGELEQAIDTIERNARVQTQLIEDLLDMSRITSGKIRLDVQSVMPHSFISAAIDTVRPASEAKHIRLETMLDLVAGPISGDPGRLQQVIWNLLSNAIKFTPRGGKVQVSLKRVDSHLEIAVADTGQGIKSDFLPFVFDRFRQADSSMSRKAGGLGLGLAIAKQLVELHGGTVRVESSGEGQGAIFIVNLPLSVLRSRMDEGERLHPQTPGTTTTLDRSQVDLKGIKVLVVDDEPDALGLISRVLMQQGAEVITANSGSQGLVSLQSARPDVLVSDIGMPEMDGYEFLRRIRELGRARGGRIPAVALTAFARSEDRTQALMAGYLVHVSKPVDASELLATVASVTGRTGTEVEEIGS